MAIPIDWSGVLTGEPARWLRNGLVVTLVVTAVSSVGATIVSVLLTAQRLSSAKAVRWLSQGFVGLFRNTPLLVQLLVWYFVGFSALPSSVREWCLADHPWAFLPGRVSLFAPEFLSSAWGLSIFCGVFLSEEIKAGLNAIPHGQREAALSQGLGSWNILFCVLLPQALRNAWQPIVGQYLNLMKLTSIACSVGLAEITYQTRLIESYNSHAFEAFAVGTILYLAIGFVLEKLLLLRSGKKA
jgi:polar amino acid transport system permease protein